MAIERDAQGIKFHELGTLTSVTRWIAYHHEGVSEWLKNARRAYQVDRANVEEKHRVAVLLLKDPSETTPGRIGLLDVGGATLEDVTAWSTWQDPQASVRSPTIDEEETQGNGGKAYMYRLFASPARILGVRDGKKNCKGFEGAPGTLDRGTPGFVPNAPLGREVPVALASVDLDRALEPYAVAAEDLPPVVSTAIKERQAFTLVEGEQPIGFERGIDPEDLIGKVLRDEQATLAVQQLRLYAIHNGRVLEDGKPLELAPIEPYPGLEGPFVYEIPDDLPLIEGETVSTTEGGRRPKGRVVLCTSRENMATNYVRLKPRWKVVYRTEYQMIGAKPVSDLAPTTPGANYIYGTIELAALEPGYVEHGRRRPRGGPLVEAVDLFVAEKIKHLAGLISNARRRQLDDRALDEVQKENQKLDRFKNRFLPGNGHAEGAIGGNGEGPTGPTPRPQTEWGSVVDYVELSVPEGGLCFGQGVHLELSHILQLQIRDAQERPVRSAVEWRSSDSHVGRFDEKGTFEARNKGTCEVWAVVDAGRGRTITSPKVPMSVWIVDHVLLTPRNLEILLGRREQIIAEVTNDEGVRSTNVYLDWNHDADDQLIVRIGPTGWVTGNRVGQTKIRAGAGSILSGVWARIPAEVTVVPNPERPHRGGGFPRLLLTDRDIDPATGSTRVGNPDQPALWQEASDFVHNIWWLNVQSPEAAFAFNRRETDASLWRNFHAQVVMDMVAEVHMQAEFTRKGESEMRDYWINHLAVLKGHLVNIVQQMWEGLEPYVKDGGGLE